MVGAICALFLVFAFSTVRGGNLTQAIFRWKGSETPPNNSFLLFDCARKLIKSQDKKYISLNVVDEKCRLSTECDNNTFLEQTEVRIELFFVIIFCYSVF